MTINDSEPRVDFDDYADQYETMLQEQLAFFSKDRTYFSAYKTALAASLCKSPPSQILDFGCGIGLSLPHLAIDFPQARLFATDLSSRSLAHVRDNYPGVTAITDDQVDGNVFDLIFVAGVFHHVPVEQRLTVMKRLSGLLTAQGRLLIFEHNPYNPVTRRMVSNCHFDADAVLISSRQLRQLVEQDGSLHVCASGYCLFFPPLFLWLRTAEKYLKWLPLGGQHFVIAGR
jgi:cyclopropane fatty-acyl-phospholipid synthase-like methyltransferase